MSKGYDLEFLQPDGTWKKIGTVDPKSVQDLDLFRPTESKVKHLQVCGKVKRRTRVCHCPHCRVVTPLDRVRDGMALSICHGCFTPFENDKVSSWLQE